jgi:phosphoketolase
MRSFKEILTESKKTYKFKIGVAGALPEGFQDRMETALKKFGLLNINSGKKTPIQERPLDFPQLQNMEVTYFETEVEYPTTTQVLQEYIGKCCVVPQSHIIVRNPDEPQERYQDTKEADPYETILTKTELGGESAQDKVGSSRVMELLKELEKAQKENKHSGAEGAPVGESTSIDDKINTKSPIGS